MLRATTRQVKRSLLFGKKKKILEQPKKILVKKLKPTKRMITVCIVISRARDLKQLKSLK
jgi:hypothetical protein